MKTLYENVVSRVLNTKKYSDEKMDFIKKRNNEKNVVLNNVISRFYCIGEIEYNN